MERFIDFEPIHSHTEWSLADIPYFACTAHSLNLVGVNFVRNSCREARQFLSYFKHSMLFALLLPTNGIKCSRKMSY